MKTHLRVETLEPRALLAGLCGIPATVLQAPTEPPPPTAQIGAIRGGVDADTQTHQGPLTDVNFNLGVELEDAVGADSRGNMQDILWGEIGRDNGIGPPVDVYIGPTPIRPLPSDTLDPPTVQSPTPGHSVAPSEPDQTGPSVENEPSEPGAWEDGDTKPDPDRNSPTEGLTQPTPEEPEAKDDSTLPETFGSTSPARADSSGGSPFVSLVTTASPTSQFKLPGSISVVRADHSDESSTFHYFEPIGSSRHDGTGLDSEPLVTHAVQETFVAFWLMKKSDLDDLEGLDDAEDLPDDKNLVAAITHETSTDRMPDHQPLAVSTDANSLKTDMVRKALAAISSADSVIRKADAARAKVHKLAADPAMISKSAAAQPSATLKQSPSKQADVGQPASPRWQLGMCSLVSILFSFRAPSPASDKSASDKSASDKSAEVRARLRRAGRVPRR